MMLVTTNPRCESAGPHRWRRSENCQGLRPSEGLDQSDLVKKRKKILFKRTENQLLLLL